MTTVAAALAAARQTLPAGEARLLLGHAMVRPVVWLLAHDEVALEEAVLLRFASLVARRRGGEPMAYLVGYREFFGREFAVSNAVLIPRPETELLVDIVLRGKVGAGDTAHILDLGTGSGCIAVTLALEMPRARVTAVDASAAALRVAEQNVLRHGARVRLLESDWLVALAGERFDLIVANPPYIADADPHLAAGDLRHEPRAALASGCDGLDAVRRIVADAPQHLTSGGQLWLEHGYDQAGAVRELFAAAGFTQMEQFPDLAGILRVTGGRWNSKSAAGASVPLRSR